MAKSSLPWIGVPTAWQMLVLNRWLPYAKDRLLFSAFSKVGRLPCVMRLRCWDKSPMQQITTESSLLGQTASHILKIFGMLSQDLLEWLEELG